MKYIDAWEVNESSVWNEIYWLSSCSLALWSYILHKRFVLFNVQGFVSSYHLCPSFIWHSIYRMRKVTISASFTNWMNLTNTVIRTYLCNHMDGPKTKACHVIIHPCPDFNGVLAENTFEFRTWMSKCTPHQTIGWDEIRHNWQYCLVSLIARFMDVFTIFTCAYSAYTIF